MAPSALVKALEKVRSGPGLGLTRIPGGAAAQRLLTSLLERAAPPEAEIEALGFRFTIDPRDPHVAAELLRSGTYEPAETTLFTSLLRPGMTVVDIGANVGVYTLLAARSVGSGGRVIAFEPVPSTAELLRRNVLANGFMNVTVEQSALADSAGELPIFVVEDHPALASFASFNARRSRQSVAVPVVALDEYLKGAAVDVIKVDVQGAETQVARGGVQLIDRCRPLVFAELWLAGFEHMGSSAHEFLEIFVQRGYSIVITDEPSRQLTIDETIERARPTGGTDVLLQPRRA